jgi:hypothetical protein
LNNAYGSGDEYGHSQCHQHGYRKHTCYAYAEADDDDDDASELLRNNVHIMNMINMVHIRLMMMVKHQLNQIQLSLNLLQKK